jgi:hypothetical protein
LNKNPFIFTATERLTQLVIMEHWAFHKLAEDLGDPTFEKVFLVVPQIIFSVLSPLKPVK